MTLGTKALRVCLGIIIREEPSKVVETPEDTALQAFLPQKWRYEVTITICLPCWNIYEACF